MQQALNHMNALIGIGGFRVDAVVNRVFLNASSSVYNDRLFNVALKEIDSIHVMLVS